jgi:hypothetical protein
MSTEALEAEVTALRATLELLLTDIYLGDDGAAKTPGYWTDHARFARLLVEAALEGKARPFAQLQSENQALRAQVAHAAALITGDAL